MEILDCSVPTSPVVLGRTFLLSPGGGIALSGSYAYVADGGDGLRVIDVSDPTNPVEVGFYDTWDWAQGVAVSGSYAYVAAGGDGLRVIDVSDPTNPVEVGFYDTGSWANGVAVSGDTAYVADGDDGIYMLDCARAVPVMLQAFRLEALQEGVRILWEVAEEVGIATYHVYRFPVTGGGPGTPVVSIPATGARRYEALDGGAVPGESYRYVLSAVDIDGREVELGRNEVTAGAPRKLVLGQNVPNPFNPSTEITVWLPVAGRVELSVYDVAGHRVATIFRGVETAGVKRYTWDGKDAKGNPLPSGVYVYQLRAGKRVLSRKIVLAR